MTTAVRAVTQVADLALRVRLAHDELRTAARTDALTGLANRLAFTEVLSTAPPGDAVLVQTAARLRGALRQGDVCARLGGDEFAVLVDAGSAELAGSIAERLVARLAEPFTIGDRLVSIGVSVGVATARPGLSADELLRQADDAMYRVKAGGKNGVATY